MSKKKNKQKKKSKSIPPEKIEQEIITTVDRLKVRVPIIHREDRKSIEEDLIKGVPYKIIAQRYDVDISALTKYKQFHLSKKYNEYKRQEDYRDGERIYKLLEKYIENVNMVAESCKSALQDPENPELIDVAPQATDIKVTYKLPDGTRKKESLQTVIDRLNGAELDVIKVNINTPDRVKTLLEASHAMNKHLHLLADLHGMIGNTVVNITNQPVFIEFTQAVIQALDSYPEARQIVSDTMLKIAENKQND